MSDNKQHPTTTTGAVPDRIDLTPTSSMDLSWLPEHERKALLLDYTKGMLDLGKKAQELNMDGASLKRTLDDLAGISNQASTDGNSVTITHTSSSSVGRTEVIMGNTASAQKGKLSKSQTGERDWTPYYIFGVLIAVVLIAASIGGG